MTQRDVVGREVGGGSCLGTRVRIKDFKIKKNKKQQKKKYQANCTDVVDNRFSNE